MQVALQRQIEAASRDFAAAKKEREREVLQLRRQVLLCFAVSAAMAAE